jgi:hypothetical protein
MDIIPHTNKLKTELLCAVKLIMPIKKVLKSKLVSMKPKSKVMLDYNKTWDNIHQ